jgi:hypothetical protein
MGDSSALCSPIYLRIHELPKPTSVDLKVYVAVYIIWRFFKQENFCCCCNLKKIRGKETKDGILDYAIPVKVNETEK